MRDLPWFVKTFEMVETRLKVKRMISPAAVLSLFVVLAGLLLASPPAIASDCARADAQRREAAKIGVPVQRRLDLLIDAAASCPSFATFLDLARAHSDAGLPGQAEVDLETDATKLATTEAQKTELCLALARVKAQLGKSREAIQLYKTSLRQHSDPAVEDELLRLEWHRRGEIIKATEIKKGLSPSKGLEVVGVEPAIDIRVHFAYDRADLTDKGRAQADEMAEAVEDPALKTRRFRVIGHTDEHGADAYNQGLSERRARAVRDYLVEHHGIDAGRITAEGHGKRDLLYHGGSDQAQAMNRRVEIAVDH